MWKKIKAKAPIVIPILLAGVLCVELLGVRLFELKESSSLFDMTEEMKRPQTIEIMENPFDLVQYILQSCKENDLDRFMRGTAIKEMAQGMDLKLMLQQNASYMQDGFEMPSGKWDTYTPLTEVILADRSVNMYKQIKIYFQSLEKVKLLDVQYVNPVTQLSTQNLEIMHKITDYWGADSVSNIIALVDYEDSLYMMIFPVVSYETGWKLYIDEKIAIYPTTKEQYARTAGDDEAAVKWYEKNYSIGEEKGVKETDILPLNYQLLNNPESRTCSDIVEFYFKSINRCDLYKTIACFDIQGETMEERIQKQATAAQQIQEDLAQTMDLRYRTGKTMLSEANYFPEVIIDKLDPEGLTRIFSEHYSFEETSDSAKKECIISTKYKGFGRTMGMNLVLADSGWIIENLNENIEE